MREYAKVSPLFWTGSTGRQIRDFGGDTQRVALYLITSPHSNMIGFYYLPMPYICHEVGITPEIAAKCLSQLDSIDFCRYDPTSEIVWVIEMAAWQIDKAIEPNDKRVKGIAREYDNVPKNAYLSEFHARYQKSFHMPLRRPSEGPYKPLRSQEQEQEQEQIQEQNSGAPDGAPPASANFKNESGTTTMLQDRRTHLRRKVDQEVGDLALFTAFPDFERAFRASCNRWRKMFPGTDPLFVARLAHSHAVKKSIKIRTPIGFIEEFYVNHFRFKTEERIRMSAIDRFADAKLKERESIGRAGTFRSADGSYGLVEVGSVLRNMMGDIGKN